MNDFLRDDIQSLHGVGIRRAQLYQKLGVTNVGALVRLYPRGYLDLSHPQPILAAPLGEPVTVRATVTAKKNPARIRGGMTLYKVHATDGSCELILTFFNNKYAPASLQVGEEYLFYGKLSGSLLRREMGAPLIRPLDASRSLQPVYPLTAGLTNKMVIANVQEALGKLQDPVEDPLPAPLREAHHLCHLGYALRTIHFPSDDAALEMARRRLGFEELLITQLALHSLRSRSRLHTSAVLQSTDWSTFAASLPFPLTGAQQRVIDECAADMARPVPMNRLIQGDVGSGKTIVAAVAAWLIIQSGMSACMMAPTEILALQHYDNLCRLFASSGVRVGLLTGSMKQSERRTVKEALAKGELDLIIGTHALLSDDVHFRRLGLVITDEQHRFGVDQRNTLFLKGDNPHLLVMSATPIPRTLALLMYGDLDISIIDELPPGRTPVETYLIGSDKRERALGYIKRHLDEGRQGYIVCPVIEEGEGDMVSATRYAAELSEGFFHGYRTALLHGRMKGAEKDAVMSAFAKGEIQLLISTTVIEVGVDVANAVIMLIENAERFGLSQLHQLRGRVGRGSHRSTCILLSDAINPDTRHRLQVMCRETSGFAIAEEDLRIRGPGELLGNAQHGMVSPRLTSLLTDTALLAEVRQTASQLLHGDPDLSAPEHAGLRRAIDHLLLEDRAGIFN